VLRTFRDKLFTEIFPGRIRTPKDPQFSPRTTPTQTNIVGIVPEEFGKGNDFCQKITYRTTGPTPRT
jgi:type I restriction enzyme R subunit